MSTPIKPTMAKTKTKTYYLHLINKRPATYCDGSIAISYKPVLCMSLRRIRREQKISEDYDRKNHLLNFEYDYALIKIPEAPHAD